MNTTITEISNIFNLMVQADSRLKFYHFGWRSDINKNIDNNFDKGIKTGRLFPALHFDVPDFFQPSEELNYLGFKEDIAVNLYFDDLQNYDNSGEIKTDNLIEQWAALKQIAEDFISNLNEVLQYYKAGFIRTVPRFEPKSNLFNDRLITFEVSFTIAHFAECTEEDNKINLLSLPSSSLFPSTDIENYLILSPSAICKSLLLDGVNEYINSPPSVGIFDRFDTFTFSMWIKPQFKSFPMIFSKYQSGTGYRLFINTSAGNTLQFEMEATGEVSIRTTSAVTFNQWQLITITHDGSGTAAGVEIYLNDSVIAKNILSDNLSSSILTVAPLEIGAETIQPLYYSGNFASFRAWNVKLILSQIIEEYNLGKIKDSPVQSLNLLIDTDIPSAVWDGLKYLISDSKNAAVIYNTVNSEEEDLAEDCP